MIINFLNITSIMLLPKINANSYITIIINTIRVLQEFKNFRLLFHGMKLYLHSGTKRFFLRVSEKCNRFFYNLFVKYKFEFIYFSVLITFYMQY